MAHIWYEGTSHRYTSPGNKVKVMCKGQGQISGSCFSKDGCFRGISVSQTHLVFNTMSIIPKHFFESLFSFWIVAVDSLTCIDLVYVNVIQWTVTL